MVEKVDLPTPPFPLRTRTLCLMPERRAVISGIAGSGPLGVDEHIFWFGQPAQASPLPASLDSGPGQCSRAVRLSGRKRGDRPAWFWRNKFGCRLWGRFEVYLDGFFKGWSHKRRNTCQSRLKKANISRASSTCGAEKSESWVSNFAGEE